LILLDIQKKIIKEFKFPLTKEQLNEISREKEKTDNSYDYSCFPIFPVFNLTKQK